MIVVAGAMANQLILPGGGGHQAIVALLEGAAPQATPNPNAPESFTFTGFVGYNARFNGLYMWNQGGEMQSEKPVYSHITQEGVGAGHDWCRLWFHSGFWRIGHFSWVHGDPTRCCSYNVADANGAPTSEWWEFKGEGSNKDHGKATPQNRGNFKRMGGNPTLGGVMLPDEAGDDNWSGTIEFVGLFKDSGDRAMPIKINVNPSNAGQMANATKQLINELKGKGGGSGVVAFQSYNQCHWSSDPNDRGYEKHGRISGQPCKSSWSKRTHTNENIAVPPLQGTINILGGDWQNAVYRVHLTRNAVAVASPVGKVDPTTKGPEKVDAIQGGPAIVASAVVASAVVGGGGGGGGGGARKGQFCSNCGKKNEAESANFCGYCGSRM